MEEGGGGGRRPYVGWTLSLGSTGEVSRAFCVGAGGRGPNSGCISYCGPLDDFSLDFGDDVACIGVCTTAGRSACRQKDCKYTSDTHLLNSDV